MSPPPNLSVSLIGLIAGGRSGVPRYARELVRALDANARETPHIEFTFVAWEPLAARLDLRHMKVRTPRMAPRWATSGPPRILAEQVAAAVARTDVLYFFDLTGPLLAPRRKFVATIHDATAGRGLADRRWQYKRLLHPWAVRHAAATVAVSDFTKREAIEVYGATEERVVVIPSGPGLGPPPATGSNAAVEERSGFLYVGNFGRNKNLPFLIRAYEATAVPGPLVLVGGSGEVEAEVRRLAAASPRRDTITILADVPDDKLDRLYRSAAAFVFPSTYEGFGFPPLEAMSRGCPVVASDIPPLRETLGDAALFAPPDVIEGWSEALNRVEHDADLRADLTRRGLENAGRFTWRQTARSVTQLLERLGGS